jgi:hypothetical protein
MNSRAGLRERRAQRRRQQRVTAVLVITGAVLVVAFLVLVPSLTPVGDITLPDPFDYPSPDDHAIGDPNAPVVIESSDLCPFCRRFHDETLRQIVDEYVRAGRSILFIATSRSRSQRPARKPRRRHGCSLCRPPNGSGTTTMYFRQPERKNIGDSRSAPGAMAQNWDGPGRSECASHPKTQAAVSADALLAIQSGELNPELPGQREAADRRAAVQSFQQAIEAVLAGGDPVTSVSFQFPVSSDLVTDN